MLGKSLTAAVAAVLLALSLVQGALAGEGRDARSSYVDDYSKDVPLQLAGGKPAFVRQVFLNVGGLVQAADPSRGVERQDQNRLAWGDVPVVGHLAHQRYRERDFAPHREVGEVYFADGTAWLDLSDLGRSADVRRLVFLNQDYAYHLKAKAKVADGVALPERPPGREIGKVFRGPEGEIVVLVRPFVVTDSLF